MYWIPMWVPIFWSPIELLLSLKTILLYHWGYVYRSAANVKTNVTEVVHIFYRPTSLSLTNFFEYLNFNCESTTIAWIFHCIPIMLNVTLPPWDCSALLRQQCARSIWNYFLSYKINHCLNNLINSLLLLSYYLILLRITQGKANKEQRKKVCLGTYPISGSAGIPNNINLMKKT